MFVRAWLCVFINFSFEITTIFSAKPPKVCFSDCQQTVIGNTKYSSNDNSPVWEYLSIPYAKPPVGSLRFYFPEFQSMEDYGNITINAQKRGAICMQRYSGLPLLEDWIVKDNITMSEDCLTLNIWVPKHDKNRSISPLYPVMVWFHGGNFQTGSAHEPQYDGVTFSQMANVLLVSVNYRLNIFGFLYADDQYAMGNMGLMDQRTALNWIRSYIENFGGDKNRVTIFGQGAGAVSASYQMMMPDFTEKENALFHRAILHSGTYSNSYATTSETDLRALAKKMAHDCDCSINFEHSLEVVACLKSVPAATLIEKVPTSTEFMKFGFLPFVDGQIIVDGDERKERFRLPKNKIPVLLGSNLHEAASFLQTSYGEKFADFTKLNPIETIEEFMDYINLSLPIIYRQKFSDYLDSIKLFYDPTDNKSTSYVKGMSLSEAFVHTLTDMYIRCDVQYWALHHKKIVYEYVFAHPNLTNAPWARVPHGHELQYLFGRPYLKELSHMYSPTDRHVSKRMIEFWSHFAHEIKFPKITWPPYYGSTAHYYEIKEFPVHGIGYEKKECKHLAYLHW